MLVNIVVLWSCYMEFNTVTALICANIDVWHSSWSFCDIAKN